MSARVQMNAYITPAVSQGFKAHYDTHDVFVVQVHARNAGRICKSSYDLPLKSQPYDESLPEPEPDQEFDLNCGDVLYMPRGTIHWARSNNSTSAHVTIGVHPVLYSQVISDAIAGFSPETSASGRHCRSDLPPRTICKARWPRHSLACLAACRQSCRRRR